MQFARLELPAFRRFVIVVKSRAVPVHVMEVLVIVVIGYFCNSTHGTAFRNFFPGMVVVNIPPSPTEFWVIVCVLESILFRKVAQMVIVHTLQQGRYTLKRC
jgi:hypothetical protein